MKNPSASNKGKLYLDLRRRILILDLVPGIDLDEVSISKEYGLSITPLQDVFRQLAGEGYITLHTISQSPYEQNHDTRNPGCRQ